MVAPAKRRAPEPEPEPGESSAERFQMKRVKREHANELSDGLVSEDEDDEDEDEEPFLSGAEDGYDDEVSDYEEPEFEQDELVAAFQAAQRERKDYISSQSESGVIKSITLIDFMCHRHLKVDFGPKMNFLVGHNGSGKSAVLTAIAVALGGKAMTTGRGQGLKDLIRKGAEKAIITLTLTNQGEFAYRPDVYTPHIVIERTLATNGSSNYKFRASKDGKTIANKRSELTAICQNFMITIDSPLTILTQDQARSFLQNADNDKLYKFFLDGTQLSSLADTYDESERNVTQIHMHVNRMKDAYPTLVQNYNSLQRKLASYKKIMGHKKKFKNLLNELAWAYVLEREQERERVQARVDENEGKVESAEQEVQKLQKQKIDLLDTIRRADNDIKASDESRQPLQRAVAEAKEKHKAATRELSEFKAEIATIQEDIDSERGGLQILQRKINAKLRLNADARREEHEKLVNDRDKFEDLLAKLNKEKPKRQQQYVAKSNERKEALKEVEDVKNRMEQESQTMSRIQQQINNLERQSVNRLSAFGSHLEPVMKDIERAQWRHSPPVGPLGQYVKLEDMSYRDVIQSLLGNNLCSFAVRHKDDRETLSQILKRHFRNGYRPGSGANQIPPIHVHHGDLFDFSRGDLSRIGPTILSKLRFENEDVLRLLVTLNKIETHFLARTIQEANAEMKKLHHQRILERVSFFSADHQSINGTISNKQSGPIPQWRGNTLFARDLKVEIERVRNELRERQDRYNQLNEDKRVAQEKVAQIDTELRDMSAQLARVGNSIKPTEEKLDEIRRKLVEMSSAELEQMEADREDRLKRIADKENQLQLHLAQQEQYQDVIRQRQEEIEARQADLDQHAPQRDLQKKSLAGMMVHKAELDNEIKHYDRSIATYRRRADEAKVALTEAIAQVEAWTEKAYGFCRERIQSTKTVEQLKIERASLDAAIKETEKSERIRTDSLVEDLRAAKRKKEETGSSINRLTQLVSIFRQAIGARRGWWLETRSHTAIRAKTAFVVFEGMRNMDGRLDFNHRVGKLAVIVQSSTRREDEDGQITARYHYKTPKNLSGGERSFSTVSLLLALWATTPCPIRALDEWDVFLDAANRNVAARNLMEGARESDNKQFILITPQDMAGIDVSGPDKKVIRMADPSRNQGTLNL